MYFLPHLPFQRVSGTINHQHRLTVASGLTRRARQFVHHHRQGLFVGDATWFRALETADSTFLHTSAARPRVSAGWVGCVVISTTAPPGPHGGICRAAFGRDCEVMACQCPADDLARFRSPEGVISTPMSSMAAGISHRDSPLRQSQRPHRFLRITHLEGVSMAGCRAGCRFCGRPRPRSRIPRRGISARSCWACERCLPPSRMHAPCHIPVASAFGGAATRFLSIVTFIRGRSANGRARRCTWY